MLGLHLVNLHPDPDYAVIVKIKGEKKCLGCGIERAVGIAYIAGETTKPDGCFPACPPCLFDHEHGELDIWPRLRPAEIRFAMRAYGSLEAARRVLFPGDYLRTIERARDEAA